MIALRISPSPEVLDDIEPLASTKPGLPVGRDVVDEVLHPREVSVVGGWRAVRPAPVLSQQVATPVAGVEGRVRQHVVGAQVRVLVVVERVAMRDLRINAADGEVHLGEPPRRVVRLLAVDADLADVPAVLLDEALALHEHAAGAAAGVVHATLVRCEHRDEQLDHVLGRVELPALLALGAGELRQEVLVDAPQHVLRPRRVAPHLDVAHQPDQRAERLLVEAGPCVVLRQHAFERSVFGLDSCHRLVDALAYRGLRRLRLDA